MKNIEYALYKGEEFLMIGTIKEIANKLNIKEKSVRFYNTPAYQKRNKGNNHKVLVKMEVRVNNGKKTFRNEKTSKTI